MPLGLPLPRPRPALVLHKVLTFAPDKLLFATDVGAYPTIPVGADLHVALRGRPGRRWPSPWPGSCATVWWTWRRRCAWARARCAATPSGCMAGRKAPSAAMSAAPMLRRCLERRTFPALPPLYFQSPWSTNPAQ